MGINILLAEDDDFLRGGMTELFEKEGYTVTAVPTVFQAEKALAGDKFDLITLDLMLPDGNGLELCRKMRAAGEDTPVLFITACDDENDIVAGLDAGADDYITKPFGIRELLARMRSLLRRNSSAALSAGEITLDPETMTVKKNGSAVFITPTEYQILRMLIKNSGVIVTRSVLLENIWDDGGSYIDDNTLSVHISRLREKVGAEHIVTVRGVGYRWEDK